MNNKYLWLIVIGLGLMVQGVSALNFPEIYQDYNGNWYGYTNENLSAHPFYYQSQNSTHYIITRMDDVLNINKNLIWNGSFDFKERDISFTIIAPASKVANISVANGSGQRRIRIPESVKAASKHFEWDNKLPVITLENSTWNKTVLQSDYWYSRQSGNLWFNFKTANVTGLAPDVNAFFYFTSWSVTNATTQGWSSANVTLNGLAFCGDGKLGLNYNASYLNGLVAAYCMKETQGTIVHNVNTESGLINTTNQGTWNGYTSINSTGDGMLFDGVDDYVDLGNNQSLNSSEYTISVTFKTTGASPDSIVGHKLVVIERVYASHKIALMLRNNKPEFVWINNVPSFIELSTNIVSNDNVFHQLVGTTNGTSFKVYLDGVLRNSTTSNLIGLFSSALIGRINSGGGAFGSFPGTIKEVRIWNRALSADEIAEDYNRSFRPIGFLNVLNQTASLGNVINRSRITVYNLSTTENITGYSRQNTTSIWAVFQSLMANNTWYAITNQFNSIDANYTLQSNGSLSPYISEIEFDEIASSAPSITSWGNNYTNNANISITIPKNTSVQFNITSNISATHWNWNGVTEVTGNGTTASTGSKLFDTMGAYTISVYGNNSVGNSNTITWTVTVSGVCCYNLSGYVSNALGVYLQNARVDTNGSYSLTDAAGYYVITDITEGTYTTLARAIGYANQSQSTSISTNTTLNFTMSEYRDTDNTDNIEAILGLAAGLIAIVIVATKKKKRYQE